MNRWVKNPKIFFAVPNDRLGVKNIYTESFSSVSEKGKRFFYDKVERDMRRARNKLKNNPAILLAESKPETTHREKVLEYIESSSDKDPVIIFAHNHNGELFFPDGSSLKTDEFSEKIFEKERLPIVLSCSTYKSSKGSPSGLITSSDLLFEDFAIALNKIQTQECLYVGDYLKLFDDTFITLSEKRDKKVKVVIGISITGVGGVGGVGGVMIDVISLNLTEDNRHYWKYLWISAVTH
uniref:CHAT domain-containing protein n=1 Tax=Candidatus Kentrum sp. LPFa TaxID=2126335 RepID=A0A450Y0H9_9GAMM|nr:MAG: hypothetical protein BECKLPF1236A_GA0070988_103224 [Candidatus Kentron sp. LPFa]VFK35040.1 MAG: hypothetical protein BECKLPF1236C_GA0070990_103254 [Candidatus Kentron sp. LPFa]